jgi:hypothetical protein
MKKVFISLVLLILFLQPRGQQTSDQAAPVSETERKQVIDSVCSLLNNNYIFPETAASMCRQITASLQKGEYRNITDPAAFAQKLTEELQSVSKDKHLRVGFNPDIVTELRKRAYAGNADDIPESFLKQMKTGNYGFREIKILTGNIGYLDLRGFVDTRFGGEIANAAMNFLSNADALIIDLRQNGGGSPSMIQLITSYLYGPEPVHLNNFYFRPTNQHTQTWTLPYVPGKRRPDIDVYVLTSKRTFSAAEEFTYNLKNLKRATIVGETTGGGAHPGGTRVATDRFTVWVPTGRAINPITNTNWEGTGVEPDIKTTADEALETAQLKAFEKMAARNEQAKAQYEWFLASVNARKKSVVPDEATLRSYAGSYGPRVISYENGNLYYQRSGNPKYRLTALDKDLFEPQGLSDFRVRFVIENGEVVALKGLYMDGGSDVNKKEKGF